MVSLLVLRGYRQNERWEKGRETRRPRSGLSFDRDVSRKTIASIFWSLSKVDESCGNHDLLAFSTLKSQQECSTSLNLSQFNLIFNPFRKKTAKWATRCRWTRMGSPWRGQPMGGKGARIHHYIQLSQRALQSACKRKQEPSYGLIRKLPLATSVSK